MHKEFTMEMVQVALAQGLDVDKVLDSGLLSLRQALVESITACGNSPLLINLGMLGPDFTNVYTHREIFPSRSIFNWS